MPGGYTWNPKGSLNPAFKGGKISDIELVRQLYETDKRSIRQVAAHCECSLRTAARWLRIHNIPIRNSVVGIRMRLSQGGRRSNWKGGPKPCPMCGGKMAKKSKRCTKCYIRAGGVNNANWRGRANILQGVRSWVADNWRPKIYERDNYTCQKCGDKRGRNLQAHHIVRFGVIVKEVLKYLNIGKLPDDAEERNKVIYNIIEHPKIANLENGVTLCKPCHTEIHKGKRRDYYPI